MEQACRSLHISQACVKPRKTNIGTGRTREAVLWKVSQFFHVGRWIKLEGTMNFTDFGEKCILVLRGHKNATDTVKGYAGIQSFMKHSVH